MKRVYKLLLLFAAVMLLSGCSMTTAEQLYSLPKRSENYNDLQSVIDEAMSNLEYCAPLTGENQQTVQMADLDGDGDSEYLAFAKSTEEKPLRILIFDEVDGVFQNVDCLESNGSSFDLVEYVQMDDAPGLELVVGRQISDKLIRTVSVYTLKDLSAELMLSTNYSKFLTVDLDMDGKTELFVLHPGQTDTDNGVAELYGIENSIMERYNEAAISGPIDSLKRILVGQLYGGQTAVYTANALSDTSLVTDVFACVDGHLSNVSFSNESGTSVRTLRNYYVYADDIDNDGVVELPSVSAMPLLGGEDAQQQNLLRWYAMKVDGSEVDKMYTFHEFVQGWYLELDSKWAHRVSVLQNGNSHEFYIWDAKFQKAEKVLTIYTLSGQKRDADGTDETYFTLLKTDTVTYAASLELAAGYYQLKQETIIRNFRLIQQDWKTGET